MVLESMMNPKNAEDKPLHIFAISVIYTFVCVYLANAMFPAQASMLAIALVTIVFVPFFQKLFELEEEKEDRAARGQKNGNIFQRHWKSIKVFGVFFLGIIAAMSFIFIFTDSSNIFQLQSETLQGFSASVTGQATDTYGQFTKFFFNNTQVMLLVFMLSAAFGAGAVFILVWNASVIAVYVGLIARTFAENGLHSSVAYLFGVPVGLGTIALHGVPEIAAYFLAGLGGGILSVGVIKEKFGSREFNEIFFDALIFLVSAELLIVIAAWIEAVF